MVGCSLTSDEIDNCIILCILILIYMLILLTCIIRYRVLYMFDRKIVILFHVLLKQVEVAFVITVQYVINPM